MAHNNLTHRLLVALMICTLIVDLSILTAARPQDNDAASVAAAIRYLQELETKHAQHARPRLVRSDLSANINGFHSGLDKIIGYFILEAIDRAHSTDARPRFGKRGGYLNPLVFGQDEQEMNNFRIMLRRSHPIQPIRNYTYRPSQQRNPDDQNQRDSFA